ncbi:MAG: hypothetical protein UT30_C0033G0003 [Candidatus Uhrbacteria bacterium GW2011_GWF2_39_13]|uniref:GmrSD restriction endonucleases N-terminal domain-containing protein n=1 Tax=Candidatus Uhrbacteria bacterium GW2011_GWF2_39_13 TaxID=1618995 RepID=A0A0G0QNL4_9BACT|nr:MAG: hypothetical protein UT30_C0033G0003 [Candidatus Uhrbacteria bacterium GW2011_GWF2_39_13]
MAQSVGLYLARDYKSFEFAQNRLYYGNKTKKGENAMSCIFSPSEINMWDNNKDQESLPKTETAINEKYLKRELRIVTELNREQLPNFVAALRRNDWMDVRPFYQRRPRWDEKRQSKLIESFIMNIPVPPLFVYESDYAKYEVMDGQQRIASVKDFYDNIFKLKGLEQWPELNGRYYRDLPSEIKKGLDRRSITYFVLLKESATNSEEELLLRQQVFERLNTGGVDLTNQEIRHCIYHGAFNDLLMKLSKNETFRNAWGLPQYSTETDSSPSKEFLKNTFYIKMQDIEVILRFFALRHVDRFVGSMQHFLDLYMIRSKHFTSQDIEVLEGLFNSTMDVSYRIYGDSLFRPWLRTKNKISPKPHLAYADAVMVGVSRYLDYADLLISKREIIIEKTNKLICESPPNAFTGQGNTKTDVKNRITLYSEVLNSVLGGCM